MARPGPSPIVLKPWACAFSVKNHRNKGSEEQVSIRPSSTAGEGQTQGKCSTQRYCLLMACCGGYFKSIGQRVFITTMKTTHWGPGMDLSPKDTLFKCCLLAAPECVLQMPSILRSHYCCSWGEQDILLPVSCQVTDKLSWMEKVHIALRYSSNQGGGSSGKVDAQEEKHPWWAWTWATHLWELNPLALELAEKPLWRGLWFPQGPLWHREPGEISVLGAQQEKELGISAACPGMLWLWSLSWVPDCFASYQGLRQVASGLCFSTIGWGAGSSVQGGWAHANSVLWGIRTVAR